MLGDKMYLHGKLCVSQPLELEYMLEHHCLQHASVNKQDTDLKRRTHIKNTRQKIADIRRHCEICQSCTHANHAKPGPYRPFPVPTRPFESVATDIFTQQPAKDFWGTTCTKMLQWVCRQTGFATGFAHSGQGLDAHTLAHEWCSRWLSIFDPPTTITSKNGPQFASAVWETTHAIAGT